MNDSKDTSAWDDWKIPVAVAMVALLVRLLAIWIHPEAYQFDAYQRWAGRDHLYIQVWLPATQVIVWTVGKLGGTPLILRWVFSVFGAITIAMIARLAVVLSEALLEKHANQVAWCALPLAFFGPYLVWSTVPYQESTLLFFLLLGLLNSKKHPILSNVAIGALALVRYEGWPLIIVHAILRRDKYVLYSLWGMLLWLSVKYFHWLEPYQASPDSFSDWNQLSENVSSRKVRHLARQLWLMFDSSAAGWFLLAVVPMLLRWRKWQLEHWMLFWAFLGQSAALIGWLLSLGVAFSRMMVLPVMLTGALSTVGMYWFVTKWSDGRRVVVVLSMVGIVAWTLRDVSIDLTAFNKHNRWERALVQDIEVCDGDVWSVYPRIHKGPRSRHDGCEVIQGLTNLRAGQEFNCIQWGWGGPEASLIATWNDSTETYDVARVKGEGASTCPY